jgi:hypothetical protein
MKQADRRPSFRLWEYLWFALMTGLLLTVDLLMAVAGLIGRITGAKRK